MAVTGELRIIERAPTDESPHTIYELWDDEKKLAWSADDRVWLDEIVKYLLGKAPHPVDGKWIS